MRIDVNEFCNQIKNPQLVNLIKKHGLGAASQLLQHVSGISGLQNSTESRITQYSREINPFLYPSGMFIKKSKNDAAFAASGKTKEIPDSVEGTTVTKGRHQPLTLANEDNAPEDTPTVRRNISTSWEIEYFHTNPQVIPGAGELTAEVAYDARQDLLRSHADRLNLFIANFTAVEWAQGSISAAATVPIVGNNFYRFTTSATTRPTTVVGGSGDVKAIAKDDIIGVRTAFTKQQIPITKPGWYLPTPEQYADLQKIAEFIDYEKTGTISKLKDGIVGRILNFNVLDPRFRDDWGANVLYSYTVPTTTSDLTKVEDTALSGANMASAGLFWMEDYVLRAEGSTVVFPWLNSPTFKGDVYAAETRYSARKKRGDNKGVVMLIDTPSTW